jgi:hypothetical protein
MAGENTVPETKPQGEQLDPMGARNAEPTVSKLRFYSLGIVAANKPTNTKIIEVYPSEELPMVNGFLDDNKDTYTAQGVDASGQDYSTKVQMGNTIKAQWVPFCDSQRMTAPDVRRGERVVIYQFGDADKYYWTTWENDNKLRKLETVIWAFSGTKNESDDLTADTSYFFEVSTHKKLVTFHTSQADGERFGYNVQIDTKNSKLIVTDTAGNKIIINSPEQQLYLQNSAGSYLDINKQIATLFTGEQIHQITKHFVLDTDTAVINSKTTTVNSETTTVNGNSQITLNTPSLRTP